MGGTWSSDFGQVCTRRPAGLMSPNRASAIAVPSSWALCVIWRMAGTFSWLQLIAIGETGQEHNHRFRIRGVDLLDELLLLQVDGLAVNGLLAVARRRALGPPGIARGVVADEDEMGKNDGPTRKNQ